MGYLTGVLHSGQVVTDGHVGIHGRVPVWHKRHECIYIYIYIYICEGECVRLHIQYMYMFTFSFYFLLKLVCYAYIFPCTVRLYMYCIIVFT